MRRFQILACPLIVLIALLLFSCGPKTPEEAVAQARAKYTVTLNTFQVVKPATEDILESEAMEGEAMEGEAMEPEAMTEGETMEEEAMEGEAMEPEAPANTEILLDLLVAFGSGKSLPGVTIEISHADPFEKEKASFRRYLATGVVLAGDSRQWVETIEVENYEPGDVFAVSVRGVVPPEERGEYREFAEYTP